jgi:hypothetical protein
MESELKNAKQNNLMDAQRIGKTTVLSNEEA